MNINNPILKYVMNYDINIRYDVQEHKRISLCSFFLSLLMTSAVHLVGIFAIIVLGIFPVGIVLGEIVGAIVTGYWTWGASYGIPLVIILVFIGAFLIWFLVVSVLTIKEYDGTNPFMLMIKSIVTRTCIQIDIEESK